MQDSLHHWWMGDLTNHRRVQARRRQVLRQLAHLVGRQPSTGTVLHQLRTCENGCESYEHQCGVQQHNGASSAGERSDRASTLGRPSVAGQTTRDLENAIDPTVPRTSKGPDARAESERTALEITHRPPAPWCETCRLGRGMETPHVRHTLSESDGRPIIAMDFALRKAQAEDGRVNDNLGTCLAMVDSSTDCVRAIA